MKENEYQVVQAIAGRTRIRIPWLKTNEEATGKLQRLIESLSYVTSVRVNPLAQSIIVLYRASAVSPEELEAQVADAIHQANPASTLPVSPAPAPTTSSPLPVAPPPVGVPAASPSPVEVEPAAKSFPTQPAVSSPEVVIPSPWDEPSEAELAAEIHTDSQRSVPEGASEDSSLEPAVETQAESQLAAEDSVHPEPEVVRTEPTIAKLSVIESEKATPQTHSTTSLAKRLNTTSQAITHRRNRADFPTWTQSQDPERIAWKYDAASQSFAPADAPEVPDTAVSTISSNPPEKLVETPIVEVIQPAPEPAESAPPKSTKKPQTTRKSNRSSSRRSSTRRTKK